MHGPMMESVEEWGKESHFKVLMPVWQVGVNTDKGITMLVSIKKK